jgi:hypothetical protein
LHKKHGCEHHKRLAIRSHIHSGGLVISTIIIYTTTKLFGQREG